VLEVIAMKKIVPIEGCVCLSATHLHLGPPEAELDHPG